MCGIILMMSNDKLIKATNRGKAFTQGVVIDTLRGPHSTGLVYTDYDGSAEMYKKPIPGYDFVNMPKFHEVIKDPELYPFMIAHNRWATKGKVNTANAHPFQHGHITGVHNGSLWTYRNLAPDQDFETDSEYIFYALANGDTGDVLKEIDGAFALVWHDSNDNTMHIARNDERPFHLAHIKNSETVLGASELEMLRLMCARNDLEIEEEYLVNTEVELIFKLDDLHKPEVIDRPMPDYWKSYYQKKPLSTSTGGTNNKSGYNVLTYNKERTVRGTFSEFVPYNNSSSYGCLECLSIDEPYDLIKINGFTQEEVDIMEMKDEFFEGTVSADGKLPDGTEYLCVSRTNIKWLTTDEAYPSNEAEGTDDKDGNITAVDYKEVHTEKKYYSKAHEQLLCTSTEALWDLRNGCATCGDNVPLEDYNTIEWWNTEPICKACSDFNVQNIMGI